MPKKTPTARTSTCRKTISGHHIPWHHHAIPLAATSLTTGMSQYPPWDHTRTSTAWSYILLERPSQARRLKCVINWHCSDNLLFRLACLVSNFFAIGSFSGNSSNSSTRGASLAALYRQNCRGTLGLAQNQRPTLYLKKYNLYYQL